MAIAEPTVADLILLTQSTRDTANTFCTIANLEAVIGLRLDSHYWSGATLGNQIRSMIQAYQELLRLPWASHYSSGIVTGRPTQTRLVGSFGDVLPSDLLLDIMSDPEGLSLVVRGQAAQALYLLGGTYVRGLQREGVLSTRQMQGSEMGISGYRGPVCIESLELLSPYLDMMPRLRSMAGRR